MKRITVVFSVFLFAGILLTVIETSSHPYRIIVNANGKMCNYIEQGLSTSSSPYCRITLESVFGIGFDSCYICNPMVPDSIVSKETGVHYTSPLIRWSLRPRHMIGFDEYSRIFLFIKNNSITHYAYLSDNSSQRIYIQLESLDNNWGHCISRDTVFDVICQEDDRPSCSYILSAQAK